MDSTGAEEKVKPCLETVPKLAMSNILSGLEMKSILSLQRSSPNFYRFISHTLPDFKLRSIRVDVNSDRAQMLLTCSDALRPITIKYQEAENGCLVVAGNRTKILEDTQFQEVFFEDFVRIMSHQKSPLMEFEWSSETLPDELKALFRNRRSPLIAKRTVLKSTNPTDFMHILPYICPIHLQELLLHNFEGTTNRTLMEIAPLVGLRLWRTIDILEICGFEVEIPIRDLLHFSGVNISMETVSAEDLLFLRETFLLKENFKHFVMNYRTLLGKETINEIFGFPHIAGSSNKGTFHPLTNFPKIMLYVFYSCIYAQFSVLNDFQ